MQGHLAKAIRSWNFGVLLNGIEKYENATRHLQTAIEVYSTASRSIYPYPGDGAWIEEDAELLTSLVVGDKDVLIGVSNLNNQAPLLWAAEKGYDVIVKLLLDKGAVIDIPDSDGRTPLLLAVEKGYEGIVKLLFDKGAAIDIPDRDGRTPLLLAVEKEYEGILKVLLDRDAQGGFFLNSALWAASATGRDKVVQMLLDKGADINAEGGYYGNALRAASARGYDKVVQMLRQNGADY